MLRRTWFGAVAATMGGLLYKVKPAWCNTLVERPSCKREPFAHQLREMTVTLVWDEDDLGPGWMNEGNLKILLYTDVATKRDLLHCYVHGSNGTKHLLDKSL